MLKHYVERLEGTIHRAVVARHACTGPASAGARVRRENLHARVAHPIPSRRRHPADASQRECELSLEKALFVPMHKRWPRGRSSLWLDFPCRWSFSGSEGCEVRFFAQPTRVESRGGQPTRRLHAVGGAWPNSVMSHPGAPFDQLKIGACRVKIPPCTLSHTTCYTTYCRLWQLFSLFSCSKVVFLWGRPPCLDGCKMKVRSVTEARGVHKRPVE